MINSNTSFGNLKEVIVGRELNLTKRLADITFKQFYKEAIGEKIYEDPLEEYSISQDLINIRNNQLDDLAEILDKENIKVYRPDKVESIIQIKTPNFKTELSSASNVRDITLIYNDIIIETPTYVRNRYFENDSMQNIFKESTKFFSKGKLIKAPLNKLLNSTIDLDDWNIKRDFNNFDMNKYDMGIDGAQFLRLGKDCIVNITTYNHYLGFLWVKSHFPETDFHIISVADNHIDGAIVQLNKNTFLLDIKYKHIIKLLPEKFQKCDFLIPKEYKGIYKSNNIQLASSRGMDINILSINENTVVVNKDAYAVIEILKENNFKIIKVQLDDCEIFGGGIHCSTLDLCREDEYKYYI